MEALPFPGDGATAVIAATVPGGRTRLGKEAVSPWEPLHGWRRLPNRSSCDYRHIVQNGRLVGNGWWSDEPYTSRGPVWAELLAWLRSLAGPATTFFSTPKSGTFAN